MVQFFFANTRYHLSITHFQFIRTDSETTFHINHSSSGDSAAIKAVLQSVEPDL